MRIGFLCVTFKRDLPFTEYLVQSYLRFAKGFSGLMIVVPTVDYHLFRPMIQHGIMVATFEEHPTKGMLDHEVQVCSADFHVPHDWDMVAHIDSDTIFSSDFHPEDVTAFGKPILWAERYSNFRESNPNKYLWKGRVLNALGIDPEWETMSRAPMIYWRWMYPKFRAAVESYTRRHFRDFVLAQRNEFPQGFAEFPSLGAFALANHADNYTFGDLSIAGPNHPPELQRPEKLIQFWSHGGLDRPIDYQNSIVPYHTIGMTPRMIMGRTLATPL